MEGHSILLTDLTNLLEEAKNYQFHDYMNTDYPAPKVALAIRLQELIKKIEEGEYDN